MMVFRLFSEGIFTISALFCKAKRNGNYIVVIKMMIMMMIMMMMMMMMTMMTKTTMMMTMIMITAIKKQITGEGKKNHRKTTQ
jgi:hypothetical protein